MVKPLSVCLSVHLTIKLSNFTGWTNGIRVGHTICALHANEITPQHQGIRFIYSASVNRIEPLHANGIRWHGSKVQTQRKQLRKIKFALYDRLHSDRTFTRQLRKCKCAHPVWKIVNVTLYSIPYPHFHFFIFFFFYPLLTVIVETGLK